jgi:DNA-binding transcriptional ArsR family regulator
MNRQSPQALDRMFHALADTTRRRMVERLGRGPASVSELAKPLSMALPSVMKHLSVLESGGVVVSEKMGRARTYRLVPEAFGAIEEWVAARKAKWNRQFDELERYLAETQDES